MRRAEKIVNRLLETPQGGAKNWVKCRDGWVSWSRLSDGRYYVTASGQRAQTVDAGTFRHYLEELVCELGGRVR